MKGFFGSGILAINSFKRERESIWCSDKRYAELGNGCAAERVCSLMGVQLNGCTAERVCSLHGCAALPRKDPR